MLHARTILLGLILASAALAAVAADPSPQSPPPPTTQPVDPPQKNAAGEWVVTFAAAPVGKAFPVWTAGDVTFTLASAPKRSRAEGRVMFFPHLKTDRRGILNAMANEQAIPVKAEIKGGANSVTLVLWGTMGTKAWLEAHDKEGKLL